MNKRTVALALYLMTIASCGPRGKEMVFQSKGHITNGARFGVAIGDPCETAAHKLVSNHFYFVKKKHGTVRNACMTASVIDFLDTANQPGLVSLEIVNGRVRTIAWNYDG